MRGYLKNVGTAADHALSAKQRRGNGSKKDTKYYSRLGAGAKGRRHQGNSTRIPECCPCHPPTRPTFGRRVRCRDAAERSARDAMRGVAK